LPKYNFGRERVSLKSTGLAFAAASFYYVWTVEEAVTLGQKLKLGSLVFVDKVAPLSLFRLIA
jgi:hypothetical protein